MNGNELVTFDSYSEDIQLEEQIIIVFLMMSVFNSPGEAILTFPEVNFSFDDVDYMIDLPNLPAGVYTFHVVSRNEVWTRKVVVAH